MFFFFVLFDLERVAISLLFSMPTHVKKILTTIWCQKYYHLIKSRVFSYRIGSLPLHKACQQKYSYQECFCNNQPPTPLPVFKEFVRFSRTITGMKYFNWMVCPESLRYSRNKPKRSEIVLEEEEWLQEMNSLSKPLVFVPDKIN